MIVGRQSPLPTSCLRPSEQPQRALDVTGHSDGSPMYISIYSSPIRPITIRWTCVFAPNMSRLPPIEPGVAPERTLTTAPATRQSAKSRNSRKPTGSPAAAFASNPRHWAPHPQAEQNARHRARGCRPGRTPLVSPHAADYCIRRALHQSTRAEPRRRTTATRQRARAPRVRSSKAPLVLLARSGSELGSGPPSAGLRGT